MRKICLFLILIAACWNLHGQYLENFTGQNGKGLVDAICPPTATGISDCGCDCSPNGTVNDNTSTCLVIPPDLTGVTWTITGSDFTGFDHSSPDDFGVVNERFQANDNDNELCWVSPVLNIAAAGAVSISITAGEISDLEATDYIKAEYSLNGGPFVQFGMASDDFTSTTFSISGLTGNTLTIRVCIDINGSSRIIWFDDVSVPQSGVFINCSQPVLSAKILDVVCGPNSGSIDLSAGGGTPPYTYAWSNGPTTQDITGLAPGTYTVTVTDGASCPKVQSFTVGNSPIVQNAATYAAYCDEANGSINLSVSGGNTPYTFAWTGGATTEDLLGLAAGNYTVTITDDGGCASIQTYSVGSQSLSDGAYLETFSTPNKGYLINLEDNFFGVNWTLSPWTQGAPGRDAQDYFQTTVDGKLQAVDVDFEVCWSSPLLNISGSGTVQFSVDLTWQTLEAEDYIAVQYSLDNGPFNEISNIAGGGSHTVQYTGGINTSSGTASISGLTGNTLQIRICFLAESNSDIITIDNVSVPQTVSLCQGPPDLCPDDPNKTDPGICGCGTPDTDTDNDGTPDCNDLCPNDPGKTAPGACGCGTPDTDTDNDGTPDCNDLCPNDPGKTAPGVCGCGTPDTDTDNDGTPDCNDLCPNDPGKTAPGVCGCSTPDTDTDNDGTPDCNDLCPNDPGKTAPGICGCGTPDTDTDNDGTPDCNDLCPNDPGKTAPGICGCGTPDTDTDNDGTPDCNDLCPNDPGKTAPGICGCGTPDTDTDNDGTPDCNDLCPNDPGKTAPGTCGCGTPDTDTDNDGTPDCNDLCPNDPGKTAPGTCGCGTPDTDTDNDGTPDCNDLCPNDPGKTAPGICGCGTPDTDTDNDGTPDCNDLCPNDPGKTAPGTCGCGTPDTDTDNDGTPDCNDLCPNDPGKTAPGVCGCGTPDTDTDNDGTPDCNDLCPIDPGKTAPGTCGCGTPDTDTDNDGTPDCNDLCPNDPGKTAPGACGCGTPDTDTDNDGIADCNDNCIDNANGSQADSDCDGVGNACDVCPGGDDTVDNNNDGLPDCAYPPGYDQIEASWKCGKNKVYVCHNGKTKCISINALQAHIDHGDYLGSCSNASCDDDDRPALNTSMYTLENGPQIAVFPSPASELINIDLTDFLDQAVEMVIYNHFGQKVLANRYPVLETAVVQVSAQELNLTAGVYYVRVNCGGTITTKAFVIAR